MLAGRQPTRVEQLAVRGSLSGGEGGRRTFASSSCETCGMPVGGARHDGLGVMMRTVLLKRRDPRLQDKDFVTSIAMVAYSLLVRGERLWDAVVPPPPPPAQPPLCGFCGGRWREHGPPDPL